MENKAKIEITKWSPAPKCSKLSTCRATLKDYTDPEVVWELVGEVDKDLNCTIKGSTIAITPNKSDKKEYKIKIAAKHGNTTIAETTIDVNLSKKNKKALALGLGLGLGVSAIAIGVGVGVGVGCSSNKLDPNKGEITFSSWDGNNGLLTWATAENGHFPVSTDWSKTVDGSNVEEIKSFMNNDLTAGIVAEGIVRAKRNEGLINKNTADNFDLKTASIKWNDDGSKITTNFKLDMTSKTSNSEVKQDLEYVFEKDGENKFAKVTETDNSTGTSKTSTCTLIDFMYTNEEESNTKLMISSLKDSKKSGWTILYRESETSTNNAAIFIPYEDFGDKLTVLDGCDSGLLVNPNTESVNLYGNENAEITIDPTITKEGETLASVTNVAFSYTTFGIVNAQYLGDNKIKITPSNIGTTTMTIYVIGKSETNLSYIGYETISIKCAQIPTGIYLTGVGTNYVWNDTNNELTISDISLGTSGIKPTIANAPSTVTFSLVDSGDVAVDPSLGEIDSNGELVVKADALNTEAPLYNWKIKASDTTYDPLPIKVIPAPMRIDAVYSASGKDDDYVPIENNKQLPSPLRSGEKDSKIKYYLKNNVTIDLTNIQWRTSISIALITTRTENKTSYGWLAYRATGEKTIYPNELISVCAWNKNTDKTILQYNVYNAGEKAQWPTNTPTISTGSNFDVNTGNWTNPTKGQILTFSNPVGLTDVTYSVFYTNWKSVTGENFDPGIAKQNIMYQKQIGTNAADPTYATFEIIGELESSCLIMVTAQGTNAEGKTAGISYPINIIVD